MATEIEKPKQMSVRRVIGQELARATIESKLDGIVDELLRSEDDRVRLDLFRFLFEQAYGKAPVRADADGAPKHVQVRFDIGKHAPIRVQATATAEVTEEGAIDAEVVG